MQYKIIDMLLDYDKSNLTDWNRSRKSMSVEWDIHNFLYDIGYGIDSAKSVDFDNKDEGKGWIQFIWERTIM